MVLELATILGQEDSNHENFLHWTVKVSSVEIMKNVVDTLPRELGAKLKSLVNKYGKTASCVDDFALKWGLVSSTESELKTDYLLQIETYKPTEFYFLLTKPKVLIFYSTEERMSSPTSDGRKTDAATEKNHIEKYLKDRQIPYVVVADPTEDEMLKSITKCVHDGHTSSLVVFVMSHGEKGVVKVKGQKYLPVRDIITHMCVGTEGKPKVCVHH